MEKSKCYEIKRVKPYPYLKPYPSIKLRRRLEYMAKSKEFYSNLIAWVKKLTLLILNNQKW